MIELIEEEQKFHESQNFSVEIERRSKHCCDFSGSIFYVLFGVHSLFFFFKKKLFKRVTWFIIVIYFSIFILIIFASAGSNAMQSTLYFKNLTDNSMLFPGAEYAITSLYIIGGIFCGIAGIALIIIRVYEAFVVVHVLDIANKTEKLIVKNSETLEVSDVKCSFWQFCKAENKVGRSCIGWSGFVEYFVVFFMLILILSMNLLPIIGQVISLISFMYIFSLYEGYSGLKVALMRKGKSFCDVWKFVKENYFLTLGIGFVSMCMMLIPIIGVYSRSIHVTIGTRFYTHYIFAKQKKVQMEEIKVDSKLKLIDFSEKKGKLENESKESEGEVVRKESNEEFEEKDNLNGSKSIE